MLKLNRTGILAIMIFVILSIFIVYNILVETSISRSEYNIDNAYYESIMYLNKTSSHIAYKRPSYDVDPADLIRLHKYIEKEKIKMLNTPGTPYNELTILLTYENITIASAKLYNVTMDLPIIWVGIGKSIDELSSLNIRKALKIYYEMKLRLYIVVSELSESIELLKYAREKGVLLDDHNSTVNYAIMVTNDTLNVILEYIKMMELISMNIGNLENNANNQTLINLAETIAKQIDLDKLKPFAKEISIFITRLSMGEIIRRQNTNTTSTENSGGISGGYSGSIEDD